jgi:hypothetical protein
VTTELILLSRVSYRDREITGPRLRGLLALLAADLRSPALVEIRWRSWGTVQRSSWSSHQR